jgi:predicted RNA-binding protein associated with RNAse of E/G family
LKRKRLDWDICPWITKKRYIQSNGKPGKFDGIAGLIYIDEVTEPHKWDCGKGSFIICEKGMKWLLFIPQDEKYMITSYINTDGMISAWYIDMIYGW